MEILRIDVIMKHINTIIFIAWVWNQVQFLEKENMYKEQRGYLFCQTCSKDMLVAFAGFY